MTMPKGGRGKKAHYDSRATRIPLPIMKLVEDLIFAFHDNEMDKIITCDRLLGTSKTYVFSEEELDNLIEETMRAKKSARESLLLLKKKIVK